MNHFFELTLTTVAALLPIINPFSTAALFLGLTEGDLPSWRRQQAKMGVIYMVAILVVFLLAGTLIMSFFGISLPGVRIAGGILVGRVAIGMLYPRDEGFTDAAHKENRQRKDVSFFPLAMPSLAGPGAIAVIITLATLATTVTHYLAIILGVLIMGVITYLTLLASNFITRWLGVTGMQALTKIMGFLIFCIAVQFVVNGVTDPDLLAKIKSGLGL
ncbi:MarC family NAAT transporter [Gallaecimonas pentaromativorans]|uniref:UPF0056 membrane protein n=1 Tax=Gallaecimonas pentaromativorans TaxID=584787 RepID=A0A3N1P620_9GAMM|nr:MarC family NAAT transporter [Gallaecimonas pentaromativorans]MED5525476.1 MarC family NAAT transporter [Pseudomonadota bacterium]ROQ27474.1 multiple antibiotic resistance protein [Gallaecimonas pentaromativorans]